MKTSESIGKIAMSLLKAQRVIGGAAKGSNNPFFKSKYADLGAVMQACKDALNEQGICVLQPVGRDGGQTYVETILLHESGEFISDQMLVVIVPTPVSKGSTELVITPQAQGSAITYARRYGLQSMLFIPAEDDDANAATQNTRQPVTTPLPTAKEMYARGKGKGLWSNTSGFYAFASAELGITVSADGTLSPEYRTQLSKAIDDEQPINKAL